jgi:hypothetical protein
MNKSRIYAVIEDPSLLSGMSVGELENLRDAYPWFSAAQTLLAKAYQVQDDHRFTDQLRHAALYTGNRRSLQRFITQEIQLPPSAPEPQQVVSAPEPIPVVEQIPTEPEQFADAPEIVQEPEAPEVSQELITDEIHALVDDILDQDAVAKETIEFVPEQEPLPVIPTEALKISVVEEVTAPPVAEAPELRIEEEVQAQTEEAEEEPGRPLDISAMDDLEKAILAEAVSSSIKIEVSQTEEDEEERIAPAAMTSMPVEEADEGADPFTRWLNNRAREVHYTDSQADTAEESDRPEEAEFRAPETPTAPRQTIRPEPLKDRQQALIERFMKAEPKITPGKSGEYDTTNIARESLEEDFTLVTETMAQLFARQGKLDKARKVYRRLIELHPEKSVYFAAQLKNLNTNKKG